MKKLTLYEKMFIFVNKIIKGENKMMKEKDRVKVITQSVVNGLYLYDLEGVIVNVNDKKLHKEFKVYIESIRDEFYFWEDEITLLDQDNSTIEKCVLNLWENLEDGQFSGLEFTNEVKRLMNTPNRYPDTILRSMRKLRQDNLINYIVVNDKKSLYAKVAIKKEDDKDEEFVDLNRIVM